MNLGRLGVLTVLFLLLAAGCTDPQGVGVLTDAPAYRLGGPVGFTVSNVGPRAVYLARCCDIAVAIDRWRDGRWSGYTSGACLATCPMDAIELGPGRTRAGATGVSDTGRYRLRLGVATSRAAAPDWTRTSNPFEVR
jgi:hypothetical protein